MKRLLSAVAAVLLLAPAVLAFAIDLDDKVLTGSGDPAAGASMEYFWVRPVSEGGLWRAEVEVVAVGGKVVHTYPTQVLALLPEGGPERLRDRFEVIPLPDLRLIGHWLYRFDPLGGGGIPDSVPVPDEGAGLYLVQLIGPAEDEWLARLEGLGLELVTFFPYAAYLVRTEPSALQVVVEEPFVRWAGPWDASFKLDPETMVWSEWPEGTVEVKVVLFNPNRDLAVTEAEKQAIRDAGGEIMSEGLFGNHEVVRAAVPVQALDVIAALADVIAVEAYHPPELDDESSSLIVAGHYNGEQGTTPPNPTYAAWLSTIGVDGAGVTVGVIDDGVDTSEVHLSGRVTDILSGATAGATGHGHHVAGIVAGACSHAVDGLGYRYGAGVAPAACILNQPLLKSGWSNTCGTTTEYGCLTKQTVTTIGTNGVLGTAQNNSWGAGTASPMTYGSTEREYDIRVRDGNESTAAAAEPLTVCFSAGNSGTAGLTRPKSAKNIITTGATDIYRPAPYNSGYGPGAGNGCAGVSAIPSTNINMMVCFSSIGNCQDGRIKPDVVAPGANVASARAGTDTLWGDIDSYHRWCSGTSQASPHTTGTVALLTDWWRANHSGVTPSPAMVKAILINTAVEIRTSTAPANGEVYNVTVNLPNDYEGWGRVNTERHLHPAVTSVYRDQETADLLLANGEQREFSYSVSSSAEPLYVTLVWTDAAGAVSANPALVNDLDLEVDWGGDTYKGNVLDTAGSTGKRSVTGGTRDSLNNVENVFLPSVSAGQAIVVRVRATTINGDGVFYNGDTTDQDFALVVYNATPCTPPNPPTGVAAQATGFNRITVTWTASSTPGITEYRIYRGLTAGGPYTQVGSVGAAVTTYDDTTVDGGVTYYYVVRAYLDCESVSSNEASATAYGDCSAAPTFAGLATVSPLSDGRCGLRLEWGAATSGCVDAPGVTYSVYRHTASPVPVDTAHRVATCVTGTFYEDTSVASATPYWYVVRAEDGTVGHGGPCNGGNVDGNTSERDGQTGGVADLLADDFETDWSTTGNWTVTTGPGPHTCGAWVRDSSGTGRPPNSTGYYAISNSDACGSGSTTSTILTSKALDASGATALTLDYDLYYRYYNGDDATTQVWDGSAWQTVWADTNATLQTHHTLDVTAYANASFRVRFNYQNAAWDYWFAVDNVVVSADLGACSGVPAPVQFLTATSTSTQNKLEWVTPASGTCSTVRVVRKTGSYPADSTDGTLVGGSEVACGGLNAYGTRTDTGLSNTTTYYYAAFVNNGSGDYSAMRTVTGRPQLTTGAVKWVYSTGATALAPPGIGSVFGVSNDRCLHSMNAGTVGGDWPSGWRPLAMNGPAMGRPPIANLPSGVPAAKTAFLGALDGRVYAVNAVTGTELWMSEDLEMVLGAPAARFSDFLVGPNLVFAGTRVAGANNRVVALDVGNGTTAWNYDGSADLTSIGIVNGAGLVDYAASRLYFTSRERGGPGSGTLWCLQFTAGSASRCSGSWPLSLGDIDGSPMKRGNVLYVGTNASLVYAVDATSGALLWGAPFACNDGPVKGYIWPDFASTDIYLATTNALWKLTDNGGSVSLAWSSAAVANPSVPLYTPGGTYLLAGSSDGRLYQFDFSAGPSMASVLLGDGSAAVGSPALDVVNNLFYVGTESGAVYAVTAPLP